MANSIKEQIAENLRTSINAITVANGFNQDLTAIRPNRLDFSGILLNDGKVFILQGNQQEVADPSMAAEWSAEFYICAQHVGDDHPESGSIETDINTTMADIEKKLKMDVTRGGLAIDTLIPRIEQEIGEEDAVAVMTINVHYRTVYTDPYTQS